ncbi:MAG: alpha/beta fold hydrolase [Calditrichaeota bacterium]|nr:alpha/beta fold hydrolase [Calditrichota bacterium]
MIYLHGFASGPGSTKGQYFLERLAAAGIQLEIPDLTGGDFEHTTITRQLDAVQQLLQSCEEDVCLIGSSLGGWLATLIAEEFSCVTRMVLIAPAFRFVSRQSRIFGEAALAEWKRRGYLPVYHYGTRSTRQLHYHFLEDARKYESIVPRRNIPTLVFHGIYDESVPYSLSVDYLKTNPQARIVLLASDHGMTDQLEVMWEMMVAFLNLR